MKDTNVRDATVNTSPIGAKKVVYNQNTYNIVSHSRSLKIIIGGLCLIAGVASPLFYIQHKNMLSNTPHEVAASTPIESAHKINIELKKDAPIQNAKTGNDGKARNNILSYQKPTQQNVEGGDRSMVENNAEIR